MIRKLHDKKKNATYSMSFNEIGYQNIKKAGQIDNKLHHTTHEYCM